MQREPYIHIQHKFGECHDHPGGRRYFISPEPFELHMTDSQGVINLAYVISSGKHYVVLPPCSYTVEKIGTKKYQVSSYRLAHKELDKTTVVESLKLVKRPLTLREEMMRFARHLFEQQKDGVVTEQDLYDELDDFDFDDGDGWGETQYQNFGKDDTPPIDVEPGPQLAEVSVEPDPEPKPE